MRLNFRTLGSGEPVFILHGVFGSSDNWQTIGKQLSEDFTVYLIDQRNHGLSPHSDEFDYEVMSADIGELIISEGLENVSIIGHSMGGKTAMKFACLHPHFVNKLVVLDIAPKYYPPHHQKTFEAFRSVNLNLIQSRKEAEEAMIDTIPEPGVRQFILKNLHRNGAGFIWNEDELTEGLYFTDYFDGMTLFIRGSESDYILDSDGDIIKKHFPNAQLVTIENAGHWVHADQPRELTEALSSFLS